MVVCSFSTATTHPPICAQRYWGEVLATVLLFSSLKQGDLNDMVCYTLMIDTERFGFCCCSADAEMQKHQQQYWPQLNYAFSPTQGMYY
jgi:hypothetical protein